MLVMQVRVRQQEIGVLQALGWRPHMIRNIFLQEGYVLAILGILPGIGIALGVLLAQKQYLPPLTIASIIGTVLVLMSSGVLIGILPALRVIQHLSLMHILRTE